MVQALILFNFTNMGSASIKESPKRIEGLKASLKEEYGVTIKYSYLTTGQYDTVFVVEANSIENIMTASLSMRSVGNVLTQVHQLFTLDEFEEIVRPIVTPLGN